MPRSILVCAMVLASGVWVLADEPTPRVQVIENRQQLISQLRFVAPEGKVAWGDLFRGVSRFSGYDDSELKEALPQVGFAVEGKFARWCMKTFNWLTAPCVRCAVTKNQQGTRSLDITVDRQAARRYVNVRKAKVRSAWSKIDWRRERPTNGIELLEEHRPARDIVVAIHGLNSRPEVLHAFIGIARAVKLTPATFRYPNDQPIDASARLLSQELQLLKRQYPEAKIRLVTHSMGGLVAREAVENPELDAGNVSQLIMIAPPNNGSTLASVATFLDCYEFFTSGPRRGEGLLVESVSDGLGEATSDLKPQSVFLDKLNARNRNASISYTILLGTQGPLEPADIDTLRYNVRSYSNQGRYVRFAASKLNTALDELDEVVDGLGDGVVSVARGRLAGVDDVVTLPFSHGGILDPSRKSSQQAYRMIQQRLSRHATE